MSNIDLNSAAYFVAHLSGSRVCITIQNRSGVWPDGVRLGFVRENREPTVITRSPHISRTGHGKLYCWIPKGAVSLHLFDGNGHIYQGSDMAIGRVRAISLLELGFRVAVNTPGKLLSVFRLILSGNQRGESFRFARAVDELNALPYRRWLKRHEQSIGSASVRRDMEHTLILVTIEAGTRSQLAATLTSLRCQSWKEWICVERDNIRAFASSHTTKYLWLNIPAGVILFPKALELLVQPFQSQEVAVVYSDEDCIDWLGRRRNPLFKPAWSPLLAQSNWLPLDGALIDVSAIPPDLNLGEISVNETVIAIASHSSRIVAHLPQVLLSRPQQKKRVEPSTEPNTSGMLTPNVSVVIPTRDRCELLADCLNGLVANTSGAELEILIVDNDSRDKLTLDYLAHLKSMNIAKVIHMPGTFNFSRACNIAVNAARYELILLLNNDVTPISPEWLTQMCYEISDGTVGAVGAYLLYPDGLVQHAGVTLGAGSVARHSFSFIHPDSGEDHGLLSERRDVSAVTGACLLTTKSLWTDVGGMDEEHLAVAFNDVDYCLKLRRAGKRVIWTPYAKLWHHESVSRGKDDTKAKMLRFAHEEATMHRRWGHLLKSDPFHSPNLSKVAEDFVLETFPESLVFRVP